ncbi:hypothetical protein DIPPA_30679 [Diplonema papillatum]|nr:hypothetical protein DIPPA_30679 [Diplonema papillatum]
MSCFQRFLEIRAVLREDASEEGRHVIGAEPLWEGGTDVSRTSSAGSDAASASLPATPVVMGAILL